MNTLPRFLTLIFCGILCTLSVRAQNDFRQKKDSLLNIINKSEGKEKLDTYFELQNIYYDISLDSLLIKEFILLCDEYDAETDRQKALKDRGLNMVNTIVFLRNNSFWNEVYSRAPRYLEFLKTNELWNYYYGVNDNLFDSYLYNGQLETAIRKANDLYLESKTLKQNTGMAVALCAIGQAYREQRRFDEAISQFEQGAQLLKNEEKITPLLLSVYWTYCGLLVEKEDYIKALTEIKAFDLSVQRFETQIKREIPSYRAVVLRLYAHAYLGTKDFTKAEMCLNRADSLTRDVIGMTNSYHIRSRIYEELGNFSQALEMANKAQELHRPKRDWIEVSVLRTKASILAKLNRAEESYNASESAYLLADSTTHKSFNDQLEEFRTQYEVDKHIADKKIYRQQLIIAIVISVFLLIIAGIYFIYSRRLKRKNESLYHQIQELSQIEKEAEKCLLNMPAEALSKEMRLYRRLSELMTHEKPFINPVLNRKKLADLLSTNEAYLADAIHQGAGETFSAYISDLRLQYALELLNDQPGLTLDAIAVDSGHGSYSPFYRAFAKKYGITPSEYRKLSKTKK